MSAHISFSASSKCYNLYDSYGMICVGCGCCSTNKQKRLMSRIELHKRLLKEDLEFDQWFDEPEGRKLQEMNVANNIKFHKDYIAKYEAELKAGGAEDED